MDLGNRFDPEVHSLPAVPHRPLQDSRDCGAGSELNSQLNRACSLVSPTKEAACSRARLSAGRRWATPMVETEGKRQAPERSPACLCPAPECPIPFTSLESSCSCLNPSSSPLLQSIQVSTLPVHVHCVPAKLLSGFLWMPWWRWWNRSLLSPSTELQLVKHPWRRTSLLITKKSSTVLPLILLLASLSD